MFFFQMLIDDSVSKQWKPDQMPRRLVWPFTHKKDVRLTNILSAKVPCPNQVFSKDSCRNTIRVSNRLIQIRPDILSGLIWNKPDCKGYQ